MARDRRPEAVARAFVDRRAVGAKSRHGIAFTREDLLAYTEAVVRAIRRECARVAEDERRARERTGDDAGAMGAEWVRDRIRELNRAPKKEARRG